MENLENAGGSHGRGSGGSEEVVERWQFSSVTQSCLFATPWTAARQASLSITNSWSLLKLLSIESVKGGSKTQFRVQVLGRREKDVPFQVKAPAMPSNALAPLKVRLSHEPRLHPVSFVEGDGSG